MRITFLSKYYLALLAFALLLTGLGEQTFAADSYKVGMTCPRSGFQKFIGDLQVAGVEIAIDEINSKGGIDGSKIELIVEDHQAKPATAVTALQKLINVDKVPLVFTTYSTTQLAQAPVADKRKVVMINTGASGAELINSGKYIFHIQPNAMNYLRIAFNYMCETVGMKEKRWVILYNNDAMGRSFNTYARTLLPKYGVKEIFSDSWEAQAVTDFRSLVAKVMNIKPDAIFLGGYNKENSLCLKQLKEAGFTGKVLHAWGGELTSKEAGASVVDGTYYAEQIIPDNERIKALKDKLLNARKLPMFSSQSVNAYDAVYLVAEAIKYAKDRYKTNYFTGEKLHQAIIDKKQFTTLSSPGTLDPNTLTISRELAVKMFKLQDGKIVEQTVKVYGSDELNRLPEGKVK